MYDHQQLEAKWREFWQKNDLYKVGDSMAKPKYYVLDMFPYPSGVGLHVGHPKGFIATDILARLKMMQGYNVLHPMGFDAFGLPAEEFAIKNKINPRVATANNIKNFKRQLDKIGLTYDWSREVSTTDPGYYKWTQWAFLKMFEAGLVSESFEPINWCPSCKTGLANEDLEAGRCERCGSEIEQKPLRQIVIKITKYADRLLADLDKLPEWEDHVKEMQRNWIGRSEGAEIIFKVKAGASNLEPDLKVYTTRIDTIFGCTYVVLAPENQLLDNWRDQISNWSKVEAYRTKAKNKTVLERTDLNKDKSGVLLEGLMAINPFNNEAVKIFVADYVLNNYGTGAVMAVPAHDERDFEFAQKYNLEIKAVIKPVAINNNERVDCFTDDGILENSGDYNGLSSAEAREQLTKYLESHNCGGAKVNYKIKDWVFSRQRYWGEPIPLIHCEKCGLVGVPEKDLPVLLPDVTSYEPTGTGESPLANISEFVNTICPKCCGKAKRETNTMPQWAGSSWYYLRYIDAHNNEALVDKQKEKYWSPVDFYVGGAEHATRHLIYARFWHKFLFDLGVVNYPEPFTKLKTVGLIMGEDGRKMSKRWGNVINPDDIVAKFGADTLRVYEMFIGPFDQSATWNSNSVIGARKFLDKIAEITISSEATPIDLQNLLHKTLKKVGEDIIDFKFNTAISALMILINAVYSGERARSPQLALNEYKILAQIIAPLAPHLAEELWSKSGEADSIFKSAWPEFDKNLIKDDNISLVVQINGKLRATILMPADISEAEAFKLVEADEVIAKWLAGKEIVKQIFVKNKLINIVIK